MINPETLEHQIAIITRTKNRAILLRRVAETLKDQTFKDFIWVIVNDAGDKDSVDQVARSAIAFGLDVLVVHRDKSIGMEAASNHGIDSVSSKYIVIHDDDDTWESDFLRETVSFLDSRSEFIGVITHTNKIEEQIVDNKISIINNKPYNYWLESIQIADMAISNHFPPISFIFKRGTFNAIGKFDESLPVLGDYDFHLRCIMQGDIGVIPKPLANYHFRINQTTELPNNTYSNSLTAAVDKHIEFDAKYRNRKLREDIAKNKQGLGYILFQGRLQKHIMDKTSRIDIRLSKVINILKKIPLLSRLVRRM